MCLLDEKQVVPTDDNTQVRRNWKNRKGQHFSFMIIKRSTSDTFRGNVPSYDTVKEFHCFIRRKFKESNEEEIQNLMSNFSNPKYDIVVGV